MEIGRPQGQGMKDADGVRGLSGLGVRELRYRLCFMACSAQVRPLLEVENLEQAD